MTRKQIILGMIIVGILVIAGISVVVFSGSKDAILSTETVSQEEQLWTCGMHPEVIMDEPGQCPKCGMDLVPVKQTGGEQVAMASNPEQNQSKKDRKILYWRAPINPTEIHDKPGKSKMGMDLIPVYEGEEASSSGGAIIIDPATVQNMGVRYDTVQRIDFNRDIQTVGKIEYNEDRLYEISTKISGWIERLYVNYTGEMVRKGQPLLEIYSPELVTTQEEYLLALKTQKMVSQSGFQSIRDGGESLLESTRKRLLYWDVPPAELERLEKTGKVKKTVLLETPAKGMVVEKHALDGAFVKEGTKLFKIADLSTVWVHASIYDYEVPWISEGQLVEMELSYLPGKTFRGKVAYVYPYLRDKARDVHVRLEFPNPDLELKPGMYVNVRLQGKTIPNSLVIPSEAVIRSGKRNIVFVARDGGKFEPREIRIGAEGGSGNDYVQVLSGLLDGEKVVTSAQFLLDSESRLQEAIQKMLEERRTRGQQKIEEQPHEVQVEQPQETHQNNMQQMEEEPVEHEHNH